MKLLLRLLLASAVVVMTVGILAGKLIIPPHVTVKAPTSRYHGYELNQRSIHKAKSFTVLIGNEGFFGASRGTGVLIDPAHVLTCLHMVHGVQDDIWIYPYPGRRVVKGHPIFADARHDLVVLELDEAVNGLPVPVFQETVDAGQPITIIGNMLGSMKWFVSFGIISGSTQGYLLTDGLIHGGNSGGPWINEQGEIVALTDWGLGGPQKEMGISGGISAHDINRFLFRWHHPSLLDFILGG